MIQLQIFHLPWRLYIPLQLSHPCLNVCLRSFFFTMSSGMWRYFPQLALTTIQKSLSVKVVTICGETNNIGSKHFLSQIRTGLLRRLWDNSSSPNDCSSLPSPPVVTLLFLTFIKQGPSRSSLANLHPPTPNFYLPHAGTCSTRKVEVRYHNQSGWK